MYVVNRFVQMYIDDEEFSSMLFQSIGQDQILQAIDQLDKYFKKDFYRKVTQIDSSPYCQSN